MSLTRRTGAILTSIWIVVSARTVVIKLCIVRVRLVVTADVGAIASGVRAYVMAVWIRACAIIVRTAQTRLHNVLGHYD